MFEYKNQIYEITNTDRFNDFLGDILIIIQKCLGMSDDLFCEVLAKMPKYAIQVKQLKNTQIPRKSLKESPVYDRISIPKECLKDREKIIAEASFLLLWFEMLDQKQYINTPIKIGNQISKIEALFMLLGVRNFVVDELVNNVIVDYLFNVERIKDNAKHTNYFITVKGFILNSPEAKDIKGFFGVDEYINTQEFLDWAVDNGFLQYKNILKRWGYKLKKIWLFKIFIKFWKWVIAIFTGIIISIISDLL